MDGKVDGALCTAREGDGGGDGRVQRQLRPLTRLVTFYGRVGGRRDARRCSSGARQALRMQLGFYLMNCDLEVEEFSHEMARMATWTLA